MKTILLLLAILCVLVLAGSAQAREDKVVKQSQKTLKEVVVTATRQEEKVSSVPANITIITEEDIQKSTAYNVPDMLRTQAGIQVNDIAGNHRNYTIDIRGYGETAPLNTLVLVDGRRINQADLSGTDWTLIPLDRIKRIEIIRGGRGSVLYGDNASGGVINIITKEGETFKMGAEAAAGSYDTFNGSAYVSGFLTDLSYALSGSYLTSDGYRDNSETEAKDLGLNLGYYAGESLRLHLKSGYHEDDTGLPGPIKMSEFAAGAQRRDTLSPDDFADTEDYYVAGGAELFFMDDDLFRVDVSYRKRTVLAFATFAGGEFESQTEIDTVTISPQIILKGNFLEFTNNLGIGLDYQDADEDIGNRSIFFGTLSTGRFNLVKKNYGYYAHDELRLSENFALSAGYRHDRAEFHFEPSTPDESIMDEDLLTGGINYNLTDTAQVYFSYARSFRYPVLDEQFRFFTNTIDTDLVPQTTDNFEAGIRVDLAKGLYAAINLFRLDTENEIFYNPIAFSNMNLDGETRRDGLEISLTMEFDRWMVGGSYTYMDPTIEEGQFKDKVIPNVAKHKATLYTEFSPIKNLLVALNGFYVGERPFVSDFTNAFADQDDYYVINAKLQYQWKKLSAFLNVNNITDEEYSEYGVLGGVPVEEAFYPSPEINFLLGLKVDY